MTLPEPTWRPSNHEYHEAVGRWSSSRLKMFRRDPYLAYSGLREAESPSEAMVIGSAINALVLEPSGSEIYVAQVETRRSESYREALRAWGNDRLVVTAKENRLARAGAASILEPQTPAAELARSLLANPDGYNEWAHRWNEPVWRPIVEGERLDTNARLRDAYGEEHHVIEWRDDRTLAVLESWTLTVEGMARAGWEVVGSLIPCQAMLDRLTLLSPTQDRESELLYVELKSTLDPSPSAFTKQAFQLDYHCQAAFNVRAVRDASADAGGAEVVVYFVAVRNRPPHEVAVYRVSDELRERGDRQIEGDLARLATCLEDETGAIWHHPWELLEDDEVPELNAPSWA